ncbi:MAG: carbohydrate-binding family 9-like protein [Armatimonadetes bacterium]|nr:carbohydrate-binding family 9-like protein [Armatimonadota bacterium]
MSDLPTYICKRAAGPIVVDGNLDEAAWESAEPMSPFIISDGSGPSARPTEARACWTDTHLYLAFRAFDRDIWGTMTGHDDPIYNEEVVEAFLDPDGDLTRYFELEISPRNVTFDALIHNPTGQRANLEVDLGWELEGWETAVFVDGTLNDRTDTDRLWTVEMAIPFASLAPECRAAPKPGDAWRANFYRIDLTPTPEFSGWSPTLVTPANYHVPTRFGKLVFAE